MKLPGLIENLSNDGCTDYEAMEIAADLMKIDFLKSRFGPSLDGNKLDQVIEETKGSRDTERRILLALGGLSDREKQCYLRHYVGLQSFGNIATELKVSKSAVQTYIERARDKLKGA